MKCIKCEGDLVLVRVGDVDVDQCDTCHGIWFDSGELAKIVGKKDVEALRIRAKATGDDEKKRKESDQKRASCPRCRGEGKLVQIASMTSDIHIDTCAVCGGDWLDGGELWIVRGEGFSRKVAAFFRKVLEM
jgi:Zn-finger nucleic acid-binding protein